jgi:hypothetical protein
MNIMKFATPALCVLALGSVAHSQTVIYTETFPATAASPVSSVGWANDITGGANQQNRIYVFQGDRVYAFAAVAGSEAFYTTMGIDTGSTGDAFPSIDPTAYQFGVSLFVDINPGFNPQNVQSRFAVQIDNGSWYVTRNALNVPTTANTVFANYSLPFDPAAANWNHLTVTGTGSLAPAGTPASVTIGAGAASPLTGNITGAGLIVTYTGQGTHNFDNFQIAATARPGDVNLDTFVTLADLTIIRQNFRTAVTSRTLGDVTNDGFVNFDDFRQWKANYVPAVGEASIGIPEPSALVLTAPALWVISQVRRRKTKN